MTPDPKPAAAQSAPAAEAPRPAVRPFPTPTDLLVLLGIYFVVQLAVGLVSVVVLLLSGRGLTDLDPETLGRLTALSSLFALSLLAAVFYWYRSRRGAPKLHVGCSLRGLDARLTGWGFLLMCALSVLLEPLYALLPVPAQDPGRGPWAFAAVVLIAPLFEEWLCRGFIFGSLRERYGLRDACLLSALFFGIIHLQPVPALNAFFLGLVLAWVYARSGTLWASVLLHAAHNLAAYLLLTAGLADRSLHELLGGSTRLYGICYAAAAVAALAALRGLRKAPRTTD